MIPHCLTLSNIRYVSRVKWSNPGKGVAPSPTHRCSSYWKGSLLVTLDYGHQLYLLLCICISNNSMISGISSNCIVLSISSISSNYMVLRYFKQLYGSQVFQAIIWFSGISSNYMVTRISIHYMISSFSNNYVVSSNSSSYMVSKILSDSMVSTISSNSMVLN